MKLIIFSLMSISSISLASSKLSISEFKETIQNYTLAGPSCRENCKNLNEQSTCGALRAFLQDCNIVAYDSSGKQTDVANVVQCND